MPTYQQQIDLMESVLGSKVRAAFNLADEVHDNQNRSTGEKYITHPVAVANTLFELGAESDLVCAALLHDVIEDSVDPQKREKQIEAEFGDQVVYLVNAVTKEDSDDKVLQQKEYLASMNEALDLDPSVIIIKMADLLHNLETISGLREERKNIWLHELKYDYMPIFSERIHQMPPHDQQICRGLLERLQSTLDLRM